MMKLNEIRRWSTERISQYVLYTIVMLTALVFGLFWLIGFDDPYVDNPVFNAPVFTDLLIVFMLLLTVGALLLAIVSIVRSVRRLGSGEKVINGIPAQRLTIIVVVTTFSLFVLTFLFGSSEAMLVNGAIYADSIWLRLSDMFVNTSLAMIAIAIGAMAYGATRYYRKRKL